MIAMILIVRNQATAQSGGRFAGSYTANLLAAAHALPTAAQTVLAGTKRGLTLPGRRSDHRDEIVQLASHHPVWCARTGAAACRSVRCRWNGRASSGAWRSSLICVSAVHTRMDNRTTRQITLCNPNDNREAAAAAITARRKLIYGPIPVSTG